MTPRNAADLQYKVTSRYSPLQFGRGYDATECPFGPHACPPAWELQFGRGYDATECATGWKAVAGTAVVLQFGRGYDATECTRRTWA